MAVDAKWRVEGEEHLECLNRLGEREGDAREFGVSPGEQGVEFRV